MLVGYDGEYIYRVWVPVNTKGGGYRYIVRSSNVVFDEYSVYSGDKVDCFSSDIQSESRGEEDDIEDFGLNISHSNY